MMTTRERVNARRAERKADTDEWRGTLTSLQDILMKLQPLAEDFGAVSAKLIQETNGLQATIIEKLKEAEEELYDTERDLDEARKQWADTVASISEVIAQILASSPDVTLRMRLTALAEAIRREAGNYNPNFRTTDLFVSAISRGGK